MDASDQLVKRFNQEGLALDTIGNGRGRGPGESLTFADIDFSQDRIWISDVNKREVASFDFQGNIINTFNFKRGTFRVASGDSSIYLLTLGDSLLISEYSFDGQLESQFGELIDNQRLNTMSLGGRLVYISEIDELAYLPHKASYIFYFSSEGKFKRGVELIDKFKFLDTTPQLIENNMIRAKSPKREFEISDWAIFENRLYLKGLQRTGDGFKDRIDFIDVYSLDGTKYYYSFKIPYIFHSFTINEQALYLINLPEQEVKALSFPFNN